MYGLKERTIGKLLIKAMKINSKSDDAQDLIHWKLPGQTTTSKMAGDFAGRCYEVVNKRPIMSDLGSMSIGEVNDLLDKLSGAQREEHQLPIIEEFYSKMNAEEIMWLVRIILRQMKVGATEKTFFEIWHPDAESLFNVSSSLRRVCWELYDPSVHLDGDDRDINLMQCFQPQLAQFQMHDFEKMVGRMRPTENDSTFWIEEKLDGERMQLHMVSDDEIPGGKRFKFWSRKAKDYTYLYGEGFFDNNSALTRHIKDAFHNGVQNIILDGEMITWDPKQDAMVPFGTLKTAAIADQQNPFSDTAHRPLFRIFDLLYLNGVALTNYTLRNRRNALEASIKSIHRRFEIHTYVEAHSAKEIEPILRNVVEEASEGLVLKNPRSPYRLNERNDDWMKVKPEYMDGYGESLDCVVIGGYYGSGRRGGGLSSFLCGLRVDENQISQGANPMKCYSFFKVGGGLKGADYAEVRHRTDGKWKDWDPKRPPSEYIELAGGALQYEKPDVWIRPDESVVVSVKAASITATDQFRVGFTGRFPRFQSLRRDRAWDSALSIQGFLQLKAKVETKQKEGFRVDDSRRKRMKTTRKKTLTVAGSEGTLTTPYGGPTTSIFEGLSFFIMTDSLIPEKKTKAELERLVKANGGKIFQTHNASPGTICIANKRLVKVAALEKSRKLDIIRPSWLLDCIKQSENDSGKPRLLLPLEPAHLFSALDQTNELAQENVDEYGDSYARDVTGAELRTIFDQMPRKFEHHFNVHDFKEELEQHGHSLGDLPGRMFEGFLIFANGLHSGQGNGTSETEDPGIPTMADLRYKQACNTARFAGAAIATDIADTSITHVLIGEDRGNLRALRKNFSTRRRLPRFVTLAWIEESWEAKTLLDEERFVPMYGL
ncbi:DNA ligase (ATP) [Xylographa bjoerkii]|nr:DNA ligase (ATP) [Xylographa bjoerkii]